MLKRTNLRAAFALGAAILLGGGAGAQGNGFDIARLFIEFNESGNDLGFHVFLDGEDWKELTIVNPAGREIFEVEGSGGYAKLGLTELFFEGAEPNLDDVPLSVLLGMFPEGRYRFQGVTTSGERLTSTARLSHAIPRGPVVSALVDDEDVIIQWEGVTRPPRGFPNRVIEIVGYQVIVGSFQVTLPAGARQVELPDEFVAALEQGEHDFEVLAIDRSGNQSITEGTFEIE
jgi:hypothetical protein